MNRNADQPRCRFCRAPLTTTFVDLGETPLANSFVTQEDIANGRDRAFPLHARVCGACFLVQVGAPVAPDSIFRNYPYFSSVSASWIEHARRYAESMITRFGLGPQSLVVEVASNDGYLLQHFVAAGVPVLGVEPAANVASTALANGIPTEIAFFGDLTAQQLSLRGVKADLVVANNVLAHVPDIQDFVSGFRRILAPEGVATFEFPHLLKLIRDTQFDTIYHEHFSYLSMVAVETIFAACGLRAFDVEEIATHGGSLRVYACAVDAAFEETQRLRGLRAAEHQAKLDSLEGYEGFSERVECVKRSFCEFLSRARSERRTVGAYGAAAKGNTFLNVCQVDNRDIVCVFDRAPAKQGRLLPGSHIPVIAPERVNDFKPDYLLVLPWNLIEEIRKEMAGVAHWGGRFVTAVPEIRIYES